MSESPSGDYRLEYLPSAKEDILSLAAIAEQAGKLRQFTAVVKEAVGLLQSDPEGWGDPEFHIGEAVVYHGTIRPVAFRYVVYEQVRGVVLLRVRLFADFV